MKTMGPINSIYFTHYSYAFRIPHRSHLQVDQRIIKRKLFTYKLCARPQPYKRNRTTWSVHP